MVAKTSYFYDIQLKSSGGAIMTREVGKIKLDSQVTLSVAP
jgi:hypothetical protein